MWRFVLCIEVHILQPLRYQSLRFAWGWLDVLGDKIGTYVPRTTYKSEDDGFYVSMAILSCISRRFLQSIEHARVKFKQSSKQNQCGECVHRIPPAASFVSALGFAWMNQYHQRPKISTRTQEQLAVVAETSARGTNASHTGVHTFSYLFRSNRVGRFGALPTLLKLRPKDSRRNIRAYSPNAKLYRRVLASTGQLLPLLLRGKSHDRYKRAVNAPNKMPSACKPFNKLEIQQSMERQTYHTVRVPPEERDLHQ